MRVKKTLVYLFNSHTRYSILFHNTFFCTYTSFLVDNIIEKSVETVSKVKTTKANDILWIKEHLPYAATKLD